jgi:hypothetical protein
VRHIAGYERRRRHATLAAAALDLAADLTDQAIDLFDRLVGAMFRRAEGRHARAFQADGRAINEKVRLYARVGGALLAAREGGRDAFEAVDAVIPWERFRATVEEAEALARSEEFDAYRMLGEHHASIRRWAPAFLAAFAFQGVPAAAPLIRAVGVLREMNRSGAPRLPESVPTGFVRERWARHVLPGGIPDRRYYELCVLSELRDRLRAGDVWVEGSRRYRSFEERLIPRETLRQLERDGALPVAIEADFERFIAARQALLDERLAAVDRKARGGLLPEVTLERCVLASEARALHEHGQTLGSASPAARRLEAFGRGYVLAKYRVATGRPVLHAKIAALDWPVLAVHLLLRREAAPLRERLRGRALGLRSPGRRAPLELATVGFGTALRRQAAQLRLRLTGGLPAHFTDDGREPTAGTRETPGSGPA